MTTEFVHLHVHSEFSMLDSAIRIDQLVGEVKTMGMNAVSLTDHGNMFGTLQFYNACKGAGVAPILGCEVNLCSGNRGDASARDVYHLVLLAASQDGYKNLVRLVSRGWVEGLVQGIPRVDFELLAEHRKGIVGLSACMGGYLAQQVLMKGRDAGRDAMARLRDTFEKDHFYVELQQHDFPEQEPLNEILVELAKEMELPLVATNDCHYLKRDDAHAQFVLQCVHFGRTVRELEAGHHRSNELYLKSPEEMVSVFREFPDAIKNTLRIAEMCGNAATPLQKPMLPRFTMPENVSEEEHLRKLSIHGLSRRCDELTEVSRSFDRAHYEQRLQLELDMICKMGFAGYFLIVQDFINWAKERGIPVGPGRGSGAGSIAAWALRITDLDPIPYGLLFERFLNPERVSMPDFDIDFCMSRRDEVMECVRERYGATSVGQIATFHELKSRSVVRDVGRVMGMTPQEAGRIAVLVPEPVQGKSVAIEDALEQEPRLKAAYDQEPNVKELLDTAMALEELTRHAGMHAAGLVISEGPLWDHVPVFCPEPGTYVTQYSKDDVEAAGLVKFDFLGLRTLTVVDIALRLINQRPNRKDNPLRIERIPLDDRTTYALLQSGETTNVFQLESTGMKQLFKQLKPDCFEDIIAAVALYRPGPLGSGMVEDFVQRKHKRVQVVYPHPKLEKLLRETYGVIVYQEQVMQIAQEMAGYSLGGADLLRRAMGKKKPEEMKAQKAIFLEGAQKKGYTKDEADKVFELMAYFAGYGFNKSHSAAYALITYQTAYLKAHYPVEFVCAALSADRDKIDKVVRTVAEARSLGITVLPPDVNESQMDFTVVYEREADLSNVPRANQPVSYKGTLRDPLWPKIRFGLGAIKGVGSAALDAILEARVPSSNAGQAHLHQPFLDLYDFASRVDLKRVNRAVIESLVQSGAFDEAHAAIGVSRAQMFAAIDQALEQGRRAGGDRDSGQTNLFGMLSDSGSVETQRRGAQSFPSLEPWDTRELLLREKASLGFYVSGHPLDRYAAELKRFRSASTADVTGISEGQRITMGGSVEAFRERTTKTGSRIAFFALEDSVGRIEVIVRPKILERANIRTVLGSADPVLVTGTLQQERALDANGEEAVSTKLILEEVELLSENLAKKARGVHVKVSIEHIDRTKLLSLRKTLERYPGQCPVTLELSSSHSWAVNLTHIGLSVEPSDALVSSLEKLFGEKICELQ